MYRYWYFCTWGGEDTQFFSRLSQFLTQWCDISIDQPLRALSFYIQFYFVQVTSINKGFVRPRSNLGKVVRYLLPDHYFTYSFFNQCLWPKFFLSYTYYPGFSKWRFFFLAFGFYRVLERWSRLRIEVMYGIVAEYCGPVQQVLHLRNFLKLFSKSKFCWRKKVPVLIKTIGFNLDLYGNLWEW